MGGRETLRVEDKARMMAEPQGPPESRRETEVRASSLGAEVSEERGEWWGLRWTLFSVSHGKGGFRSPGTKGQFLKRAWRKWSRTGWAPEGCLHILCVGVGEGELLLEEGHWDEVPSPLRGA